jgi:hypothetical protein
MMTFFLGFLALSTIASAYTVIAGLRHAPEAYEDADGFHFGREPRKIVRVSVRHQELQPAAH